jgi:aminoglycoside phosphotransferase
VDDDADCISCSDADEVLADARDPTEKRIAELEDKVERLRLNSEAQTKLARKMSHKAADLEAEVERLPSTAEALQSLGLTRQDVSWLAANARRTGAVPMAEPLEAILAILEET